MKKRRNFCFNIVHGSKFKVNTEHYTACTHCTFLFSLNSLWFSTKPFSLNEFFFFLFFSLKGSWTMIVFGKYCCHSRKLPATVQQILLQGLCVRIPLIHIPSQQLFSFSFAVLFVLWGVPEWLLFQCIRLLSWHIQ